MVLTILLHCMVLILNWLLLLLLSRFSRVRPVRPHRWQPTSLPCPWASPGKNTGVGCHFLLQFMKVKSQSEVAQSCPTLRDPMDWSLPTRLLCPWDFPGKSTGVGCHRLLCLTSAGQYNPRHGFCHKLYEVTTEPQIRKQLLLHTHVSLSINHTHKHTAQLVKYSRKHVC